MWEDVRRCEKMWEDVKMRRWGEDGRMRRCEDEKMWRWEDVKMRRCEDERMWRWEDVKMRGCEDEKMWRWEDVLQTPTIGRTLRSDALGKKRLTKPCCNHQMAMDQATNHPWCEPLRGWPFWRSGRYYLARVQWRRDVTVHEVIITLLTDNIYIYIYI